MQLPLYAESQEKIFQRLAEVRIEAVVDAYRALIKEELDLQALEGMVAEGEKSRAEAMAEEAAKSQSQKLISTDELGNLFSTCSRSDKSGGGKRSRKKPKRRKHKKRKSKTRRKWH